MALKAFFVEAHASGRATPIVGGPKLSTKESSMKLIYSQADRGENTKVLEIESIQRKRGCLTKVTIYPTEGGEPIEHIIKTRL